MSTATLKAEVQTRINAIVYSSGTVQASEVLQLAVDTVGLGLTLTNIISVHNSMTTAIVVGTSDDDLTALNAASIALGITSKSAGGVFQAEMFLPMQVIPATSPIGDLVTIGTAGKLTKLTYLAANTTIQSQGGITVTADGFAVISNSNIGGYESVNSNHFTIRQGSSPDSDSRLSGGGMSEVVGEFITISTSVETFYSLLYSYQTGGII